MIVYKMASTLIHFGRRLRMKKYTHLFVLLLAMVCCMLTLPVNEAQAIVSGDFEFEKYYGDTGYRLTAYHGTDAVVTVPATVNGTRVTIIEQNAFENNLSIQQVILPEGLIEIKNYAFENCTNLAEVNFPSTLETIDAYAFQDTGITKADLSGTNVTSIDNHVFYNCASLTEFSFPSTLETIDVWALRGTAITKADLSGTKVTSIGNSAFCECTSLAEVNFPSTLETIDAYAFQDTGITKADLSGTKVTTIGYMAFYECTNLAEVNFPSTLETIEQSAFLATGITKADLSGTNVTSIGNYAFENCASLAEVSFPSTLASIGRWAFWNTAIKEMYLPENITSVGGELANDNIQLFCSRSSQTAKALGAENHFCDPSIPDWLWAYDENETLMVAGYLGDERNITLPSEATAVAPYSVWKDCQESNGEEKQILSITIPEGYTAIGKRAFDASYEWDVQFTLPSTLKTIGEWAFSGLDFKMIQLPEGLETIEEDAFTNCSDLQSLTIPTTVTRITEQITGHSLPTVVLPAELTEIADMAFSEDLTDVYCYRGSYAEEWAKEQAKKYPLTIHYIKDNTFSGVAIKGPEDWDEKGFIHDVGATRPWMEKVSVLLEPGKDYKFACTSSDPAVARVNGHIVEYLKPGKVTLTISVEGRDDIMPCKITKEVYKPVEDFSLPGTMFVKLKKQGTTYAYAPIEIEPADANPYFECRKENSWQEKKAGKGSLEVGRSNGKTQISNVTVTSWSGISKMVRVVFYNTIDSLEAYAPTRDLIVSETYDPDITLTVDGSPIGDLDIYTITSSNPNVAVGVAGKHVKAVGCGTATITVKEAISGFSTKFVVNVDARDALITPRALQVVGSGAFAGIEAKEVILYEECTAIQSRAFANCTNLERIEIPASVETIAADAFEGCSKEMVIVTPSWSEAKKFADANGFQWENLVQ